MKKIQLSASILSANFAILKDEIVAIEKAGVSSIHFDVMDMHYVPNLTFGEAVLKHVFKATNLPINVHFMVDSPIKYIENYIKSGADSLIFHIDTKDDVADIITMTHRLGCKVGLALNPDQSVDEIIPWLDKLDRVLVMSVYPGFSGQEFIKSSLDKIKSLKKIITSERFKCFLEVDGGIKLSNSQDVIQAGADSLVMGSGLFCQVNYDKAVLDFYKNEK
jgi:ribulose-phosphate 3-epimerase